jgi:hypothetical protein
VLLPLPILGRYDLIPAFKTENSQGIVRQKIIGRKILPIDLQPIFLHGMVLPDTWEKLV